MQAYVDEKEIAGCDVPTKMIVTNKLNELSLAGFYSMLHADGLLDVVYHQQVPTLRSWLDWHADPKHIWLGCVLQRGDKLDLVGMAWVNDIEQRGPAVLVGEVGHGFLKEFQRFITAGIELPREFVRMSLRYVFGRTPVTLLVGTTPIVNRAAVRFISKCGFSVGTPIPDFTSWQGKPCAAVLSWMTREAWVESEAAASQVEHGAELVEA